MLDEFTLRISTVPGQHTSCCPTKKRTLPFCCSSFRDRHVIVALIEQNCPDRARGIEDLFVPNHTRNDIARASGNICGIARIRTFNRLAFSIKKSKQKHVCVTNRETSEGKERTLHPCILTPSSRFHLSFFYRCNRRQDVVNPR